nr:oxidoreductase siro [Quercus suber]
MKIPSLNIATRQHPFRISKSNHIHFDIFPAASTMSSEGIKVIYGGAMIRPEYGFDKPERLEQVFSILSAAGVKYVDTSARYEPSEELLGKRRVGEKFIVDTKTKGSIVSADGGSKENVIADAKNSRAMLGTNVDVFYMHSPGHPGTSMEETLQGIKEVYESGFFKRFGLSNYHAEDVEKMYNLCKEMGLPTPSVYQGNYNPVARKQEEVLFPTLRKLGMSFYAYTPLAGGFLTKTKQDVEEGKGRFDKTSHVGKIYRGLYARPAYLAALEKWEAVANEEGVTRAELAYRWVTYNSALKPENGDGIIIGASSDEQLKETLEKLEHGPLSEKALEGDKSRALGTRAVARHCDVVGHYGTLCSWISWLRCNGGVKAQRKRRSLALKEHSVTKRRLCMADRTVCYVALVTQVRLGLSHEEIIYCRFFSLVPVAKLVSRHLVIEHDNSTFLSSR